MSRRGSRGINYSNISGTTARLLTVDVDEALPLSFLFDPDALAQQLDIPARLLWYIVRERNNLYTIKRIAKRSGKGTRELHVPSSYTRADLVGHTREHLNSLPRRPSLKKLQRKILEVVLGRIHLGKHVGAYVHGRSIKDTASQHVGKQVVISMDLKDFFPSVHRGTIRAYLHRVQKMPDRVASMLAALMCYKNFVPQGSPTSGAICNIIADWKFDSRLLSEVLRGTGWVYTRYSDDITLSHAEPQSDEQIQALLDKVHRLAEHAGFQIHPDKTRIMRRPAQQKVLGLVVNDKVGVDPELYRELRATVHNCLTAGVESQAARAKMDVEGFVSKLSGKLAYLQHIDAEKAAPLVNELGLACQRRLENSANQIHS